MCLPLQKPTSFILLLNYKFVSELWFRVPNTNSVRTSSAGFIGTATRTTSEFDSAQVLCECARAFVVYDIVKWSVEPDL